MAAAAVEELDEDRGIVERTEANEDARWKLRLRLQLHRQRLQRQRLQRHLL